MSQMVERDHKPVHPPDRYFDPAVRCVLGEAKGDRLLAEFTCGTAQGWVYRKRVGEQRGAGAGYESIRAEVRQFAFSATPDGREPSEADVWLAESFECTRDPVGAAREWCADTTRALGEAGLGFEALRSGGDEPLAILDALAGDDADDIAVQIQKLATRRIRPRRPTPGGELRGYGLLPFRVWVRLDQRPKGLPLWGGFPWEPADDAETVEVRWAPVWIGVAGEKPMVVLRVTASGRVV